MIHSDIRTRPMADDHDFWRMRKLLIDTVSVTPLGFNWDVRRLDGKRFYNADLEEDRLHTRPIQLWETAAGELTGFVLSEGSGDAHLQLHPDYRDLEPDMVAWAEANLAMAAAEGECKRLEIYVYEYDEARQRLLAGRGFIKTPYWGMIRRMQIPTQPLPAPVLPAGYTLRTTQPEEHEDCQRIADLLNAAFGRSFHNAAEYQNFTRLAPCFHRELDLVVVAPDGVFAAYTGIPYDETNRLGIFEPVCTHPDHLRKGLAQALMREGLRRLQAFGAVTATVDTGDMIPANRLYNSIGFTEAQQGYAWHKVF